MEHVNEPVLAHLHTHYGAFQQYTTQISLPTSQQTIPETNFFQNWRFFTIVFCCQINSLPPSTMKLGLPLLILQENKTQLTPGGQLKDLRHSSDFYTGKFGLQLHWEKKPLTPEQHDRVGCKNPPKIANTAKTKFEVRL